MKFLADENISPTSVSFLRGLGFEALHVREVGLKGKPDPEILRYAFQEKRILITLDKDFADIRKYPPGTHAGIIRMRLRFPSPSRVNTGLELLLKRIIKQELEGNVVITDGEKYRIRRKK